MSRSTSYSVKISENVPNIQGTYVTYYGIFSSRNSAETWIEKEKAASVGLFTDGTAVDYEIIAL